MDTTTKQTKHSARTRRLGSVLAGAVLLAAVVPSFAAPRAPRRCGPNGDFGGGVKVPGCAIDDCVRKGGGIEVDAGRAYCCVTTGAAEGDPIKICEQVDQLIDMIVVSPTTPPTSRTWSPRPFGAPSRFAR